MADMMAVRHFMLRMCLRCNIVNIVTIDWSLFNVYPYQLNSRELIKQFVDKLISLSSLDVSIAAAASEVYVLSLLHRV